MPPAFRTFGPFTDENTSLLRKVQERVIDAPTDRGRGPSLAHDLGCNPLCYLGEGAWIVHQRNVRVAEDVNKAGASYHARRIYHLAGCLRRNASRRNNFYDAIPVNGNIPIEPGIAGPVHDFCSADQGVNSVYRHVSGSHFHLVML